MHTPTHSPCPNSSTASISTVFPKVLLWLSEPISPPHPAAGPQLTEFLYKSPAPSPSAERSKAHVLPEFPRVSQRDVSSSCSLWGQGRQ